MTAQGRPVDLVAVGEGMVELRAGGPLGQATVLERAYGGDTLNTLITASRLGLRTAFVSRVGNDPFGPGLRTAWQGEGVNVAHAPLVNGENGVYFIQVEGAEREFTYRRSGSAASELREEDVPEALIASARVLLLSGITQAISAGAQAATRRAAQLARLHGVRVAYDPNYRPALWQRRGGLDAAAAAYAELRPEVDLLLPSLPADGPLLDHPAAQAADQAAKAVAGTWGLQVTKLGAQGARLSGAGQAPGGELIPIPAPVTVVDSTGAGDAFNAALLCGLLQGRPLAGATRWAHRVAALTLGHRGALPPRPAFLSALAALQGDA